MYPKGNEIVFDEDDLRWLDVQPRIPLEAARDVAGVFRNRAIMIRNDSADMAAGLTIKIDQQIQRYENAAAELLKYAPDGE